MKRIIGATIQQLSDHARSIATQYRIPFVEIPSFTPENSAAVFEGGQRWIVTDRVVLHDCHYAIVMHELGHCIAKCGFIPVEQTPKIKMMQELAAWEWAEENALDWTTAMEQVKHIGLSTYTAEERAYARYELELLLRAARPKESISSFLRRLK